MSMPLTEMRRHYQQAGLHKADCHHDPVAQMSEWLKAAHDCSPGDWFEVNAMTLSTATLEGEVSSRVVLLKGFSEQGIEFFTNYASEKGRQLAANPRAAVNFYWPHLERQVRAAGTVRKVSREQSLEYFRSRPRGSQLGALTSSQSEVVASRSALEQRLTELTAEYEGREVPLPEQWGGYLLEPVMFEFWQGQPDRLHDRLRYRHEGGVWVVERLSP